LGDALATAVQQVDLGALDDELRQYADADALKRVASAGLRGEVVFAVPLILRTSPFLLGYYRLLYGLSQKEFYHKGPFGRFKRLETDGEVSDATENLLSALCRSLAETAKQLVSGLDEFSANIVHELQLLTLGPQFRGSENTKIGDRAIQNVRELIGEIVDPFVHESTPTFLRIENAAGRPVLIEFASDPDVLFTEKQGSTTRLVLSIEVKGGADASNIHNRLGEAEKSHLKAKRRGCTDLWTLTKVDVSREVAERASPTTTRFFNLTRILDRSTADCREFREALCLRLGVPVP
jgi:hypothetical protein